MESEGSSKGQGSPEVEARVSNKNILIKIHCQKQKGMLMNLLTKVESLNLLVVNTNVTSFGASAHDITIIAEMEEDFNSTTKEVVAALRATLS